MKVGREWLVRGGVAVALVAVLALPFALRREGRPALVAEEVVVVLTPHNEAIRAEFALGFERWYRARTGRGVAVDWRVIGGTSEIARFLEGAYRGAFEAHWVRRLGRPWSETVRRSFDNPAVPSAGEGEGGGEAQVARREFLASEVGCGIDVFFGGGSFDFMRQAAAGRLVEARVEAAEGGGLPEFLAGERLRDERGLWAGAALSSFGIIFNRDALARLGVRGEPRSWRDLMDGRYLGEIALADPTKSGSIAKAFEMVVQSEMQARLRQLRAEGAGGSEEELEARAVAEGWVEGLRVLQRIGANARYFTDSAQKPPIDVAQGDAAAGMCIDFFGRAQVEAVERRSGRRPGRVSYVTPVGGSVYSPDPIALLRGAPNADVGRAFIDFVLSREGQALWNTWAGEPGGPEVFSLRRLPIRREAYAEVENARRSDPEVDPYAEEGAFVYRREWTGDLFRELAFVFRILCLDAHGELVAAWRAVLTAGQPERALAELQNVEAVDLEEVRGRIRAALVSADPLAEPRLARELGERFREQYRRAVELAR